MQDVEFTIKMQIPEEMRLLEAHKLIQSYMKLLCGELSPKLTIQKAAAHHKLMIKGKTKRR